MLAISRRGPMQQRTAHSRTRLNLTRADRIGHVAGGLGLLAWALGRRGVTGLGVAGLGGWLLYQAYRGANPIFRSLGIRVNPRPVEQDAGATLSCDEVIMIQALAAQL